ncbi:MAG: flavodoxin-dependent (E)-4-hydroxy-3-methylbut-2-enyl-diphosphate synthase [archaeon]
MIKRKKTRKVKVGKLVLGDNNPIRVQSMTNTKTENVKETVKQINQAIEAGCEIIRCTANTIEAAKALKFIRKEISIPLVADIHFDYRCALEAAKHVDKLRINPGNIGSKDKTVAVVKEAKDRGLAIRIGVNSGSVDSKLLQKYGGPTADAMVESALSHVKILEENDFYNTLISAKAHDVPKTLSVYRLLSKKTNYPLHLGVTHSGVLREGIIKSSVGLGILLQEGIGDTLRISLASKDLRDEVETGYSILKSLRLREAGPNIIVCPTCGRCEVDVIKIAETVKKATKNLMKPLDIAVMGCVVNGPGESREADIGVCCGKGFGAIYRKGKFIKKVPENEITKTLLKEIEKLS